MPGKLCTILEFGIHEKTNKDCAYSTACNNILEIVTKYLVQMASFIFILQTLSSTSFFEPLKSFFQSKRIPAGCVTQLRVFCDDSSLTKSFRITTQQKKTEKKERKKEKLCLK